MAKPNTSLAVWHAEKLARDAARHAIAAAAKNNTIVTARKSADAARKNNEAVLLQMLEQKQGQMWIVKDFERLEGQLVGSGQCPAIVQSHAGLPLVREWFEGPKVRGNPVIPYGTAVATFVNGKYPNYAHGNHVAIYIDQHPVKGVLVFDQWKGGTPEKDKRAGPRWMPFGDGRSDRSNDGAALSIILTRKGKFPPTKAPNVTLVPEN